MNSFNCLDANTTTWDRANRLTQLAGGGNTYVYTYNGDSNRLSQSVNGVVTKYLLDTQPSLALVIGETTGANTTRDVHSPRGIHATQKPTNAWEYPMQDGLGSVRGRIDANGAVLQSLNYSPYGVPDSAINGFAFTGEERDSNGFQYHRARYYNPQTASLLSLDPFEGFQDRAMSLNGYSWVEGNVPNATDASGQQVSDASNCDSFGSLTSEYLRDRFSSRCHLANSLLQLYPESKSVTFWLRFGTDKLQEVLNNNADMNALDGSALAIVPLDFVPVTGQGARDESGGAYQGYALNALRNLEISLGRPATFAELLAIMITGELSPILENAGLSASRGCGRTVGEFQQLTREAALRYFHGQCRRDGRFGDLQPNGDVTGQCGPGRLVGNLLSNIQSFYDENYLTKDFTPWLGLATRLISFTKSGGYTCSNQGNSPFIWGNTPSPLFPDDPPIVGRGRVIDWIDYPQGNYKYFVLQSSSNCPASGNVCSNASASASIISATLMGYGITQCI